MSAKSQKKRDLRNRSHSDQGRTSVSNSSKTEPTTTPNSPDSKAPKILKVTCKAGCTHNAYPKTSTDSKQKENSSKDPPKTSKDNVVPDLGALPSPLPPTVGGIKKELFAPVRRGKNQGPSFEEQNRAILNCIFDTYTGEEIMTRMNSLFSKMGMHPLLLVASIGHQAGLEKLLKAGVDPNLNRQQDGNTALHLAAKGCHARILMTLMRAGADPSTTNNDGCIPLMSAVETGCSAPVKVLYENRHFFNIDQANSEGRTALHAAIKISWTCCAAMLIRGGANKDWRAKDGTTALHLAAMKGDMKSVTTLVDLGADVLIEDNGDCTAICAAVEENKMDVVNFLLDALSTQDLEKYVQRRVELLWFLYDMEDSDVFFEDVLYPVYRVLARHPTCRTMLYNARLMCYWLPIIRNQLDNETATEKAFHAIIECLCSASTSGSSRVKIHHNFVEQFMKHDGPEVVMAALGYFRNSSSSEIIASSLLPLLSLPETAGGRKWLERHYYKISQYVSLFEKEYKTLDLKGDMTKCVATLWKSFKEMFNNIQAEQAEIHGAELVACEEREKVRREKKREKRRQRRHLQKTKVSQTPSECEYSEQVTQETSQCGRLSGTQQTEGGDVKSDWDNNLVCNGSSVDSADTENRELTNLCCAQNSNMGDCVFEEVMSKKQVKEMRRSKQKTNAQGSSADLSSARVSRGVVNFPSVSASNAEASGSSSASPSLDVNANENHADDQRRVIPFPVHDSTREKFESDDNVALTVHFEVRQTSGAPVRFLTWIRADSEVSIMRHHPKLGGVELLRLDTPNQSLKVMSENYDCKGVRGTTFSHWETRMNKILAEHPEYAFLGDADDEELCLVLAVMSKFINSPSDVGVMSLNDGVFVVRDLVGNAWWKDESNDVSLPEKLQAIVRVDNNKDMFIPDVKMAEAAENSNVNDVMQTEGPDEKVKQYSANIESASSKKSKRARRRRGTTLPLQEFLKPEIFVDNDRSRRYNSHKKPLASHHERIGSSQAAYTMWHTPIAADVSALDRIDCGTLRDVAQVINCNASEKAGVKSTTFDWSTHKRSSVTQEKDRDNVTNPDRETPTKKAFVATRHRRNRSDSLECTQFEPRHSSDLESQQTDNSTADDMSEDYVSDEDRRMASPSDNSTTSELIDLTWFMQTYVEPDEPEFARLIPDPDPLCDNDDNDMSWPPKQSFPHLNEQFDMLLQAQRSLALRSGRSSGYGHDLPRKCFPSPWKQPHPFCRTYRESYGREKHTTDEDMFRNVWSLLPSGLVDDLND